MARRGKRVSPFGKFVAAVAAAIVGTMLNSAVWYAIVVVLHPPAIIYLVGGLVTMGVIVAGLYTWTVDGPVQWRSRTATRA